MRGYILIKCNMGLYQGKGLLNDVFVLRSFEKNSRLKIRCFLYLLTWKRLLIKCQEKLFVLLLSGRVSQNIGEIWLCILIKVVKLLSQFLGNYQASFLLKLVSIMGLI